MTKNKVQPLTVFNAEVVQKPLRGLLMNIDRVLEKKMKEAIAAGNRDDERRFSLLLIMLRVTFNSYEAVCFLLNTEEKDPKRKNNFALIVPPANRQILDLLFTLVFMMEDFPARSTEYEIGGYRYLREEYDKLDKRFGALPNWQPYLGDLRDLKKTMEAYWPVTPAHIADPTTIKRWLGPSKLKKKASKNKAFMEHLDTWLYGEVSAQAHLNAAGLMQIGAFVLSDIAPEEMREVLENRNIHQYIFRHFSRTLATVLAITSEIDTFCGLNNRAELQYLWVTLSGYVEDAKDLYDGRYQAMLT